MPAICPPGSPENTLSVLADYEQPMGDATLTYRSATRGKTAYPLPILPGTRHERVRDRRARYRGMKEYELGFDGFEVKAR